MQADWVSVDKSTFCRWYKDIKERVGSEKYWEIKGISGEVKEQWARAKCGSVGKVEKKGFSSWVCRICCEEAESLEHIWKCEEARVQIKIEWVRGVDEWRGEREGENLEQWTGETLKGEPIVVICEYRRAFKRVERPRTEVNRREVED